MNSDVKLHFLEKEQEITVAEAQWQHWNTHQWSDFLQRPRPHFGLILILEGRMDYSWEGGGLTLTAGDLGYLPKGCCYDVRFRTDLGKVESMLVNFQAEPAAPAAPARLAKNCLSYRSVFEPLIEAYEQNQPFALKGQFYLLLHLLSSGQNRAQNLLLEQATALLEQDLPMKEIAQRCNISESSLRRLFTKQCEMSPVAYRTRLKLQKACRLLVTTDQTVDEIAAALNFYDEAYFCKVFTKNLALSPTQYRKEHQMIL